MRAVRRQRARALAEHRNNEGLHMPIIRVEMYEGRTVEQKRELAAALTSEACRILKCGPEQVHVVIDNISKENWALGGKLACDP